MCLKSVLSACPGIVHLSGMQSAISECVLKVIKVRLPKNPKCHVESGLLVLILGCI